MKVLTCASYYGTGSSAVTDLFSEYVCVKKLGDYEFRILHDIDGVSDLEFHLVECQNRHNSGHSIKRFKKLISFYSGSKLVKRYEPFFDNQFSKISNEYIDSLIDFKYRGWWFYDLYDKGRYYYFFKQLQNHFIRAFTKKTNNILHKEMTFCSAPSEEHFLELTRDYTSKLLKAANKENKEYLEIDQIVPSQNLERFLRYFKDDIYVFVVDRDPRDIYLCEMLSWHSLVIPHDPIQFCKWYKYTHNESKTCKSKNVIYLHFEDLIYKYESVVETIEKTVGLNPKLHNEKFSFLNPKRSVVNTRIFQRNKKYRKEIQIIERELQDYLYDFDSVSNNEIVGIEPSSNSIF